MRIPWEALDDVESIIADYLPDQVVPQTRPQRLSTLGQGI
jgi:hypothetical protein